jgi:hypothetical protein
MMRPVLWLLIGIAAAPPAAYLVYRLARALGFLEPPLDRQHELRRTIVLALYAFLAFLPVLIYGFGRGWPRAWILFGVANGLALVFFAASGIWAGVELWKLRHPEGDGLQVTGDSGVAMGADRDGIVDHPLNTAADSNEPEENSNT